jgi:AGZA family xanthine/uracil permease-like MFS transporter
MLCKVRGALLLGIVGSVVLGVFTQFALGIGVGLPDSFSFDLSGVGNVKNVAFAFFGEKGFGSLFSESGKVFAAVIAILAFVLTDIFDTIGTFIGTGRQSGIFTDKDEQALKDSKGVFKTRFERGLFSDLIATTTGALTGTSNVTTYVESGAGISAGGRTGLTALTTGLLLLLCIPLVPFIGFVQSFATSPALIIVGILMASAFVNIKWGDFEEALPAFMTVAVMTLTYSITNGIAMGFIFYCLAKLVKGKAKEIHPILAVTAAVFIETLSAPAFSKRRTSATSRTPPPTVKGMKTCSATCSTTCRMMSRSSELAVMSRKVISSAPCSS